MSRRIPNWLCGVALLGLIAIVASPGLSHDLQGPDALDKCWQDLAADDAELAYRAIWRLVRNPEAAAKLLREHLKAAEAPDLAQIQVWVKDLSSATYAVREKANRELQVQAELAELPLRKALEAQLDLESRRRVEMLLNKLEQPVAAPEKLRQMRAVEALEMLASAQSKELLELLAKGYPEHRQTRQAQESLLRLKQRAPAPAEWLTWTKSPPAVVGKDDPLPFGARTRLGTTRFRHQGPGIHGPFSSAFSPDGRLVISHDQNAVYVWETQTGKLQRKFDFAASCLAAAPKGTLAALGLVGKDRKSGAVVCMDWHNGKELSRWELPAGVTPRQLAFSPDGAKIICRCSDDNLREWDFKSGKEVTLWQPTAELQKLHGFSPDGAVLVVGSKTDYYVLDLQKKQMQRLPPMDGAPGHVAFSPDTRLVAFSADRPGERLHICDATTGRVLWRTEVGHSVYSRFSADGNVVAVSRYRQEISLWDVQTGKFLQSLPGSNDCTIGSISADGRWLVTAGHCLEVWNLESGQRVDAGDGHPANIDGMAFSPRYDWIATVDHKEVHLWDPLTGKLKCRLDTGGTFVRSVSVSPDGKLVAAANPGPGDGFIKTWETASGRLLYHFPGHAVKDYGSIAEVHFSLDGRFLLSWGDDHYFRKWDMKTGRALQEFATRAPEPEGNRFPFGLRQGQYSLARQPDRLLRLEANGALHSFDVDTGKEGPIVNVGATSFGDACAFSPTGKLVAFAGRDSGITVRDATSGKLLFTYALPTRPQRMSYSPDGRTLGVVGEHKMVVFEIATGKVRLTIAAKARALTFSSDSRFLTTAMADTTALLWDLALLAEAPKK